MKTKTEIRQQIRRLYALKKQARGTVKKNGLSSSSLKGPFQIIDYVILGLKWAIDYKVKFKGEHYWCFKCHIMHPEPTCPKCGSNRIMKDEDVG